MIVVQKHIWNGNSFYLQKRIIEFESGRNIDYEILTFWLSFVETRFEIFLTYICKTRTILFYKKNVNDPFTFNIFALWLWNFWNHKSFICFYHYRETKRKLVSNVRDVLIQEIMTISGSEFEGEAIDMDSVAFAGIGIDKLFWF